MFKKIFAALVVLSLSTASDAQQTLLPQWGTPPSPISLTANPTATQYASVAMYRWDPARQVGVRIETYAIPAYPLIPVGPPGSGGGGVVDPNAASGTDRDAPIAYRGTTSFPEIIVRAHRWWGGIGRLGVTLIDSYERIQAVRESLAAQCNSAQMEMQRFQCDADDGDPPASGCGSVPNGFVGGTTASASQMFANACTLHSACLRVPGESSVFCGVQLQSEMKRACDLFYPISGIPGSSIPVSTFQNLNNGCRLQADVYATGDIPAQSADAIALLVTWYGNNMGQVLGSWARPDNMPTSPAAVEEARRQAKCKAAQEKVDRYCVY
jgi:hypothetical protein